MKAGWAMRAWGRLGIAVSLLLLMGCSPDYNWRQVAVADGRVMALFPAKPATEQRDLPFEGGQQPFIMTQAQVNENLFVVGYAPWGQGGLSSTAERERFGHEVLLSLYRNLGVAAPETLPLPGERFTLRGGAEETLQVVGHIWLTPHGLLEGLVLAPDELSSEHMSVFFEALEKGVGGVLP
ncbi:hypothetical protein H0484_08105 [Pusillimonas sp. CC-YST705]|uniref:Lipoprotein n=1 Tax=Mesopusillimonas faecipullorum TaxID=2755040 RepID=A0ABS8CCE8_9BURK|nr:hypothetical protein [Mesopusillimonas faecipullorum]MCB5363711.1 hypothetical protein [Mesopusillimonas faecipullorum]